MYEGLGSMSDFGVILFGPQTNARVPVGFGTNPNAGLVTRR